MASLTRGFLNVGVAAAMLTLIAATSASPWFVKRSACRTYARTKDLGEECVLTIFGNSLHFQTGSSSKAQQMHDLNGWLETETLLLLDRTDQKVYAIPKRALGDELDQFRNALRIAGVHRLRFPRG